MSQKAASTGDLSRIERRGIQNDSDERRLMIIRSRDRANQRNDQRLIPIHTPVTFQRLEIQNYRNSRQLRVQRERERAI